MAQYIFINISLVLVFYDKKQHWIFFNTFNDALNIFLLAFCGVGIHLCI